MDPERVTILGVARPQRAAVFDATDTASGIMARAAVMPTAADAAVSAATTIAANVTAHAAP